MAAIGNPGWAWDDVLPFFKRFEDHHPHAGSHEAHAGGGRLGVSDTPERWYILKAWKRVAIQAGIPETLDFNRGDNERVGVAVRFRTRGNLLPGK